MVAPGSLPLTGKLSPGDSAFGSATPPNEATIMPTYSSRVPHPVYLNAISIVGDHNPRFSRETN
jgi:hypothetical protein